MITSESRPVFIALILGSVVSVVTVVGLGFSISSEVILLFMTWPVVAIGGMLARRIGKDRLSDLLLGIALIYGQGLSLLFILFVVAAFGGPLVDHTLANIDEAVGFHWPDYVRATLPYSQSLTLAYRSFAWQPLLLVVSLVMAGQSLRMWTLILATIIASALTAVTFLFTPAEGVFNYYGVQLSDVVKIGSYTFDQALNYFRDGGRYISPKVMTGLVSFPSYHTAESLMFVWAGLTVPYLRWPLVALNVIVLASVPVIGAHYLTDMVGGAVVAMLSIITAKWVMTRMASNRITND